ncbi:MAG: hypothetical protein EOP42_14815 [Sphingobacteriaceae bacterium]|nr:MAG: hypothetical protein EOP42_14815 [Sphingobacteriaceae bacterium]
MFTFEPGFNAKITTETQTENWEIYADGHNQNYFYSKETGAAAYFINTGSSFYFTSFYGEQNTLLYYFFLAAYHINFSAEVEINDEFPLSINPKPKRWLQDVVAPFYRFTSYNYQSNCLTTSGGLTIFSKGSEQVFKTKKQFFEAQISICEQKITGFNISINYKKISIKW